MILPTRVTRLALTLAAVIVVASATFLLLQYPSLPGLLPVHFKPTGFPNGWQYKTLPRVLMPVFVQLSLAAVFSSVGALLLSRPRGAHDHEAPDVKAAAAAAEAVALIALVWLAFQGFAAFALIRMWSTGRAGLGPWYGTLELVGVVLTAIVSVRMRAQIGRPAAPRYVPEHWRWGWLYVNAHDPALFVPTRTGKQWTLNFGRPLAAALLGLILVVGVLGPVLILGLALRG